MFRGIGIRWRLAGSFFLVIFLLVFLAGYYLLRRTEARYIDSVSLGLRRSTNAVAQAAAIVPAQELPGLVSRMGEALGHRITIVASDGTVVADSEEDFHKMRNHADRPEIRRALATGSGHVTRHSATLNIDMLYVATRHALHGNDTLVVRAAEPLSGLKAEMSAIQRTFVLAGLAALLLAAVLSLRLASGITDPIRDVSDAARKVSSGDLTARVPTSSKAQGELRSLAATFNSMAEELQKTIQEITKQRARMQTVFDKSDDGFMLVASSGEVQMLNPVACNMLGIEDASVVGRTVIEGTLSHDLAELVERVMRTRGPAALDISVPNASESSISAYVAPIGDQSDQGGALVVLHDVTESRRLDAVRRDFVANVSHELRTPLASIKAMAETILLRGQSDPSVPTQFAQSIVREADRMLLLAEDLLDLARIESGQSVLNRQSVDLDEVIDGVFSSLRNAADAKSVSLCAETEGVADVTADRDLLAQILTNLVDNAVKFSHEGGRVVVSADRKGDSVEINVCDNGTGIPDSDLPRIFERFYRVDKARSRESGGTGLGLSIVKHLSELMGGSVSVASEPDLETTFTVILPAS